MKFREKSINKLYAFAMAAVFALVLAGCGGGGGSAAAPDPEPTPMPTPQEMCTDAGNHYVDGECLTPAQFTIHTTLANIAAATTAEDAQAAYDAVKDDVTATTGEMLQAAVDARIEALDLAARVGAQKMALTDAAGMIDTSDLSTQEAVDAANEAIRALRQALEDADDVSDADKAMYMSQLDDAVAAVDEAQGGIDTATRRMNQMDALTSASGMLQAALAALSGQTPTQARLDAANTARTALNAAITDAADLTDAEKATYVREAANAAAPIRMAQAAFDEATSEADKAANEAMMATAMKLYAGISAPIGDPASPAATDRAAAYNADGNILVSVGDGTNTPTAVELSEDKDTTVAAQYGWTGMRFTAEPDGNGGTYEAVVYSNVGEPTEGEKFSVEYTTNFADGVLAATIVEAATNSGRVASPRFDQSSGLKRFPLPDPNPTNQTTVTISGSFHGVAGTYSCTPGASAICASRVAADGFELGTVPSATDATWTAGNGQWTFMPTNPDARLMDVPNTTYASYGWWIHKSEDGETFTASAFAADRGTVTDASGIAVLQGTATYMGGAAGKYALRSMTGGTNDAGHFTARATLEADFGDDTITGIIDNFMGVDGQARNWSVELKESVISDTGVIIGSAAQRTANETLTNQMTVWTIGGTAGSASGQWSGTLQDNGADGVPKIGTGTFSSMFGTDGNMVGAFGVNKQ